MSEDKRTFSEFSFYSPVLDSECTRISVSDGRTGEFFVIVKNSGMGRQYREARTKALQAIEAAMDSGLDAQEIRIDQ